MQQDNNRGQQEQGAEPDGVLQPSEMRCMIGCHRVKHQNLAGGPKANAAGQAPKQIVFDLSAKIELLPFDRQITWIKFEAFALAFSYKKTNAGCQPLGSLAPDYAAKFGRPTQKTTFAFVPTQAA